MSHRAQIDKQCHCDDKKPARYYSEKHDAWYCGHCLIWLESQCDDRSCSFCDERPGRPFKPEIVDPEDCGCTDCITGYSRPAYDAEDYAFAEREGRAR